MAFCLITLLQKLNFRLRNVLRSKRNKVSSKKTIKSKGFVKNYEGFELKKYVKTNPTYNEMAWGHLKNGTALLPCIIFLSGPPFFLAVEVWVA
jgi:hypothetical protein